MQYSVIWVREKILKIYLAVIYAKKMYIMILTLKVQNTFLKNPINVDVGTYEIVLNLYISKL